MSNIASTAARWWLAIRPKTLTISVAPVLVGTALALAEGAMLRLTVALAALAAALLIQIGTNLHNDAVDAERGADTPDRAGPARATASGWFSAAEVRLAALASLGLAFLLGCYLAWVGGWPIVAIGLLSLGAAIGYTGGAKPIAYSPSGELFVLFFFGIAAVGGSAYLQSLTLGPNALLLGIALGMPAAAVLLVNNYRDLETDRRAGRRTLCGLLGRPRARRLYALLLLLPFVLVSVPSLPGRTWLVWLLVPLALLLLRRLYTSQPGPALNPLLGATARFQLLFSALLSLALFL